MQSSVSTDVVINIGRVNGLRLFGGSGPIEGSLFMRKWSDKTLTVSCSRRHVKRT